MENKSEQQKEIEKATELLAELFMVQLEDKYHKKDKPGKKLKKNIPS